MKSAPFRFDPDSHLYISLETGEIIPSITQMLEKAGLVETEFFTEESSERGTAVHELTAAYDLGGLDPKACESGYRAWLLQYVDAVRVLRPAWDHVEVPAVHPVLKFGGTLDRAGTLYRLKAVVELKTGNEIRPHRSHEVQTALQAILAASTFGIPAETIARFAIYLSPEKWQILQHPNPRDFQRAYGLIRRYCA